MWLDNRPNETKMNKYVRNSFHLLNFMYKKKEVFFF